MKHKMSKKRIVVSILILLLLVVGFNRIHAYLANYYQATDSAMAYIDSPADNVTVEYVDNTIVFAPKDEVRAGFIFYPGGLVQSEAYAPLLEQLAEDGIECILVEMPYYLAILDANGARGIQAKYPEINEWYIGGHSLGGAMACLYADRHSSEYEGLILLAAYSTKELTDDDIDVLLVRGSEDKVLKMDKYNKNLVHLPSDYQEVIIDGGCHSYFGDYGTQSGDGEPTITVEEQTQQTVDIINDFIK